MMVTFSLACEALRLEGGVEVGGDGVPEHDCCKPSPDLQELYRRHLVAIYVYQRKVKLSTIGPNLSSRGLLSLLQSFERC